ncbi:MAG: succinate dehydrogenase assembly factor 2 [Gammaproteobacteria bacterium]|nr:succinate dehydrogenase assembly factor 2 [Gammaproteobacteria bacterium]MDE2252134.1 succinate dehydrogenase assembly factor 2 [Gammaproteobacteria bacterium]
MSAAPGQLAWRCRRGVKELDLILGDWVERRYAQASDSERALFQRFLELPDPELAGYLLHDAKPADPDFAALVAQLAHDRS